MKTTSWVVGLALATMACKSDGGTSAGAEGGSSGSGSGGTTSGKESPARKTIGSDGGTIESEDGKFSLSIPKDALPDDVEITWERQSGAELPDDWDDVDALVGVEMGPDGLVFENPSRARYVFAEGEPNTDEVDVSLAALATLEDGQPTILPNHNIDVESDGRTVLSADVSHFSHIVVSGLGGVAKASFAVQESYEVGELVGATIAVPDAKNFMEGVAQPTSTFLDESVETGALIEVEEVTCSGAVEQGTFAGTPGCGCERAGEGTVELLVVFRELVSPAIGLLTRPTTMTANVTLDILCVQDGGPTPLVCSMETEAPNNTDSEAQAIGSLDASSSICIEASCGDMPDGDIDFFSFTLDEDATIHGQASDCDNEDALSAIELFDGTGMWLPVDVASDCLSTFESALPAGNYFLRVPCDPGGLGAYKVTIGPVP